MARIKAFNRRELKFVIHTDEIQAFVDDVSPYLDMDAHTGDQDFYRITSLYFDSAGYAAYWEKLEGVKYRRKIRIRVYSHNVIAPQEECFVEVKERVDWAVRKRRIIIPYKDAHEFCTTGYLDRRFSNEEDQPVIDEIAHLSHLWGLEPSCAVRYDRRAYNGHPDYDPSLRVTFDTNCRARIHDLDLSSSHPEDMKFFLSPQLCILEIKADNTVPYWLVEKMHQHKFLIRKISKYCTALENLKIQLERQNFVMPSLAPAAVPRTNVYEGAEIGQPKLVDHPNPSGD